METDENTLSGYQLAVRLGFHFVECDPRPTKDGVLVTMHDSSVDRTTNGRGQVADLTWDEIKALRTSRGDCVPAVEEILVFAKSVGVGVYLDTKLFTDAYMQALMDVVAKIGMERQVIVGLWRTSQLEWMHSHYPQTETCISWPVPLQTLARAKKLGASWIGTIGLFATSYIINRAHQHGLKVVTLQINEEQSIRKKIAAGIDAVQTDNPALKRNIVR